jgi:hypothetical protein
MCDVPSIAVFCSESVECFPGIPSRFFLKLFVTITVAPILTGMIVHFRFHICCVCCISTTVKLSDHTHAVHDRTQVDRSHDATQENDAV